MKRRTKIVCTLGPAVDSREAIRDLIAAGMNVARINCSHGDWEPRLRWIKWIRELSPPMAPVAVLVDLQGPKFRIGELPEEGLLLKTGDIVTLGREGADIPIHQPEILAAMGRSGRVLFGDGEIELKLLRDDTEPFDARVVNGGLLKSRKGVTMVGKAFDVPALTPKDREDVVKAIQAGADIIALSYVKNAADVRELRDIVDGYDPQIALCAKIEMRQGIKDLENILRVVDIVMVARGDMGLQMDIEEVPIMQKQIICQCTEAGKPVITATQMLESMINLPRPTRAEATDVANAILDGTDAVMLSAETSIGKYPMECVRTMVRIAEKAEAIYDREKIERDFQERAITGVSHTDALAHAVSELAGLIKPNAIVCTSTSGQTPRLVSKFRPKAPILCATWRDKTYHQMAVVWGVEAIMVDLPSTTDEEIEGAIREFVSCKRLKKGDMVIVTAGVPVGEPGNTNLILTQIVK
ncbi:MAG: pyruvate kinase [Fimbriimonas sp.]